MDERKRQLSVCAAQERSSKSSLWVHARPVKANTSRGLCFCHIYTWRIQRGLQQRCLLLNPLLDQHIFCCCPTLLCSSNPSALPQFLYSYTFSFIVICPAFWPCFFLYFLPLSFSQCFKVDSRSFPVEVTCKLIGMCRLCVCGTCARGLAFARVRVCCVNGAPRSRPWHERTKGALKADSAAAQCACHAADRRYSPDQLSTTGLPHPHSTPDCFKPGQCWPKWKPNVVLLVWPQAGCDRSKVTAPNFIIVAV